MNRSNPIFNIFKALSLTWILFGSLASCFEIAPTFENLDFQRLIDISGSYVKETVSITIKNIAETPQEYYYLGLNSQAYEKVSVIEGRVKGSELGIAIEPVDELDTEHDVGLFRIVLPEPLNPQKELSIRLAIATISRFNPVPEEVEQSGSQYLSFSDVKYVQSPYDTVGQLLTLKFPGSFIEEVGDSDQELKYELVDSATLNYGPYKDIPAWSNEKFQLRYEHPRPVNHASLLEREVWISQWGNTVSFEETYYLNNPGTKLKGRFSRGKYADSGRSGRSDLNAAAIKGLIFPLMPGSREAYYTDFVGNVSLSNFISNENEAALSIQPRYPVFGGWNYNFTIGWSNNIQKFVKSIGSDQYLLRLPLIDGPHDISYDKLDLKIILPDGAFDVETLSALEDHGHGLFQTFSYLDNIGRPTVQLKFDNIIDGHRRGDIFIKYNFRTQDALWKPLIIGARILAVFSLIILLSNISLSLGSPKTDKK